MRKEVKKHKNEYGTIKVASYIKNVNNKQRIVISFEDDGTGLNIKKLKEKYPELSQDLNLNKVMNILFSGQVSTKDTVSEFSGRGVGLDAVKQSLKDIGGDLFIESKQDLNQNTEFLKINFNIILPNLN